MDKYFKNKISEFLLTTPINRRAVMGYDPVNDEMIFSLMEFNSSVGTPNFLTKDQLINSDYNSSPGDTSDINVSYSLLSRR